jgi:cell division protein FtsQ
MNAESIAIGEYELRIPWIVPRLLAGLVALLALAVMAVQVTPFVNRPVTHVQVNDDFVHLNAAQVARAADVANGTRLFDLDLDAIRTRVEALPWVAHAQVGREWPDAVTISLQERTPVARWGERSLLDSEGHVFTPPDGDQTYARSNALPLLAGPEGRVDDVQLAYRQLSAKLADGPFALDGLRLDARGEWTAHTRSGIELRLGQEDPVAQAALINGSVARSLTPRMDAVAYVDLRYPNGYAVGWRQGGTTATAVAKSTGARK